MPMIQWVLGAGRADVQAARVRETESRATGDEQGEPRRARRWTPVSVLQLPQAARRRAHLGKSDNRGKMRFEVAQNPM